MNAVSEEHGYTLLEVLVSLVLLFILLTPTTYVLAQLFARPALSERSAAISLAQEAMELALLRQEYASLEWKVKVEERSFLVQRKLNLNANHPLLEVTVISRSLTLAHLSRSLMLSKVGGSP